MIETARLLLRKYEPHDIDAVLSLTSDELIRRFVGNLPNSREDAWQRILRSAGHWSLFGYGPLAVVDKKTDRILGEVGAAHFQRGVDPRLDSAPEASWLFAKECQGRGLASEAMSALLEWLAHTAGQPCCGCLIEPDNTSSVRLAQKMGFRLVDQVSYRNKQFDLFTTRLA